MTLVILLALPLFGAVVLGLLPRGSETAAKVFALLISAATFAVAVTAAVRFDRSATGSPQLGLDVPWITPLGVRFHLGVDGISLPLVVLTALLVLLCCIAAFRTVPAPGRPAPFLALVLLLEVGMLATFVTLDLVAFFAAFEIVLLPMYFLIAIWGGHDRRRAATKFVLYTLLGSTLMLLSFLALHASAHTFDLVELSHRHGLGLSRGVQDVVFLGLFVGFAIKAPLWPLHTWLPDAHSEAPTAGSVLLAGVLLKMGTYGLLRIAVPVLPQAAHDFAPLLGILAVTAIVYGALCCLAQTDLKRLIAYSSVGHMGFVLLGVATLTPLGLDAALFGNIAHGVITGLLFFLAGSIKERFGTYSITDIGGGLLARLPRIGALLTFAAVASLGLPGLAGFWGEVLALLAAYQPAAGLSLPLFRVLLAFGLIGTLLTAGYFLWMLQRVNLGRPRSTEPDHRLTDLSGIEALAFAPLVAAILVLGIYPKLVLGITHGAVVALLGVAP